MQRRTTNPRRKNRKRRSASWLKTRSPYMRPKPKRRSHCSNRKVITHGYALHIEDETTMNIERGAWASLNIQEQWTINEKGDKMKKKTAHI